METLIDILALGSTFLLYTLGFSFQIRQNFRNSSDIEAVHPLVYILSGLSLFTLTAHSVIHGNWIVFWAILPGDLLGSILLYQFSGYYFRKRRVRMALMMHHQSGSLGPPHESS